MLLAASNGHLPITRRLLEVGANAEAKNRLGDTPLHKAARMGHVEIMKILLEWWADVEAMNYLGDTALHLALRYGKEAAV